MLATSTVADPATTLAQLHVLDAGVAGKLRGESHYSVLLQPGGVVALTDDREEPSDGVRLIDAIKLPEDFFPPDSHVTIAREVLLNCTTVCSLTLKP